MEATTGGTRRHLVDLVTHLARDQFDVSVICSNLRDSTFDEDIRDFRAMGIPVHIIPMVREISAREDFLALRQLVRHFQAIEYDIVHAHSSKAGALARWALYFARGKRRPKVVYTPHVFPFLMRTSRPRQFVFWMVEKLSARHTDHWIAVSQADYRAALAARLCNAEQLSIIYNGVDLHRFPSSPSREAARRYLGIGNDRFVLGAVGRLTRQKGQVYLLRALPQLVKQIPNLCLLLIGDGEDRPFLEKLTRWLNLEKHVIFAGNQPRVEPLYPGMDIFLLASLWEGCPYTLLEAMYSRLPVVASDIEGNREIVTDGETGLLIPPASPEAIAAAVVSLHNSPEQRVRMGCAAHDLVVSSFTVERMCEQTGRLYQDITLSQP